MDKLCFGTHQIYYSQRLVLEPNCYLLTYIEVCNAWDIIINSIELVWILDFKEILYFKSNELNITDSLLQYNVSTFKEEIASIHI